MVEGRLRLVGSATVGVLAGFLSGLFGVGGGILIVPGLVLLMGMGQRLAHGTSLAAIAPIAVAGVAGYAIQDSIDWIAAGLITLGAASGAIIGTRALRSISPRALRLAFVAFLLVTAIRLLVDVPQAAGRGSLDALMVIGLIALGVVSGTLAGLLGVGGGIVIIPVLVLLFSVPDVIAKGTSLAVIIPTAMVGTVRNMAHGNADLPVAAVVGLFGVASAFGASQLAVRLSPTLSGVLFATLLLAVAANMILRDRGGVRAEAPEVPIRG
jgi:uncharacterized membrane protein YfcA